MVGWAEESAKHPFVWRVLFECGHLKLSGPWWDDSYQPKIFHSGVCLVCPLVESIDMRMVYATRQIVDVVAVSPSLCALEEI